MLLPRKSEEDVTDYIEYVLIRFSTVIFSVLRIITCCKLKGTRSKGRRKYESCGRTEEETGSRTCDGVGVHAELAVVHRPLVQAGLQPLHHRRRGRQTKEALRRNQGETKPGAFTSFPVKTTNFKSIFLNI